MDNIYKRIPEEMRQFLKKRSALFNQDSVFASFEICKECGAKCCKEEIPVSVTAIDLISIGLATGKNIDEVVKEYCQFSFELKDKTQPLKWKVGLKLKKPCPFLKDNRCSIYTVSVAKQYTGRPIACAVFPENAHSAELINHKRGIELVSNLSKIYPCAKGVVLSESRELVVLTLSNTLSCEDQATELILFDQTPFIFDFEKPLETMEKGKEVVELMEKTNFKDFVDRPAVDYDCQSMLCELFETLHPSGSPFYERFNKRIDIINRRPVEVAIAHNLVAKKLEKSNSRWLVCTMEQLKRELEANNYRLI